MKEKPVGVALLSFGMSGAVFHEPLLTSNANFRITKIWNRSGKANKHRHPVVSTLDEILEDNETELVVVNTPNHLHHAHAEACLRAGKHVVVEKPFAVSSSECLSLIEVAESSNKLLTVFQNRRWDGDFITAAKIIREGKLGKMVSFEAHYDRWRNYVEADTWKEMPERGTGILYNLGSHMIDQALTLFGLPLRVQSLSGIQRPGGRVMDFYDLRLEYSGFYVTLKSSYLVKIPGPRYIIHGTHGSFVKYGLDTQEQALKEGKRPGGSDWGMESPEYFGHLSYEAGGKSFDERVPTAAGDYPKFYQLLYKAIRTGTPVPVDPRSASDVIRVIEAAVSGSIT